MDTRSFPLVSDSFQDEVLLGMISAVLKRVDGPSLRGLARRLGVSPATLSRILARKRKLSPVSRDRITAYLRTFSKVDPARAATALEIFQPPAVGESSAPLPFSVEDHQLPEVLALTREYHSKLADLVRQAPQGAPRYHLQIQLTELAGMGVTQPTLSDDVATAKSIAQAES